MVFGLVPTTGLAKMGGGCPQFLSQKLQVGVGGGEQNLDILSRFRKYASFLGLFGRKSSQKSPNFLRSRIWRSRNSFFAVPCLMVRKNPTYGITMGVHLEKLTFNSRLDNSHVHMSYTASAREVPTAFLQSYYS